ncbi:hypothetical protein ACHAP5_008430 [Fusarium lateritium]
MDFDQFCNSEEEDYCSTSKYNIPLESTCKVCTETDDRPTSREFFVAHNYAAHWTVKAESEDMRWRAVEAESDSLVAKMKRLENQFIFRNSVEFLSSLSPQTRRIHQERLHKIRECKIIREISMRRKRGQFIDDGTDNSSATVTVNMSNPVLETSVPIQIVKAEFVRAGRWYLGHAPGTHIFRYQNHQNGTDNLMDPFMGSEGIIVESDFRYVGQVPRHPFQHGARCRRMFKFILTLFISALQFKAGSKHKEMYPDLEDLLNKPRIRNDEGFELVWKHWKQLSHEPVPKCWVPKKWSEEYFNEWPDDRTRTSFSAQKHMQELAWHLVVLRRNDWSGDRDLPRSCLWQLIVSSTGLQVEAMAELWVAGEEKVARAMLRSGSRKGLFVYQVEPETEDIHQYYRQAPFSDDPFNPRVKYLLAPGNKLPQPAAASQPNAPSGVQQNRQSPESNSTADNQS